MRCEDRSVENNGSILQVGSPFYINVYTWAGTVIYGVLNGDKVAQKRFSEMLVSLYFSSYVLYLHYLMYVTDTLCRVGRVRYLSHIA